MSSVRNFHAHLAASGFWKVLSVWSALYGISALSMFVGMKTWLVVSGIGCGLIAVPLIFMTLRFWWFDRSLAHLQKQLEQISSQNESRQKLQETPAVKMERCERCACKTLLRSDGKRRDPHYSNGLCVICDGTGFVDPAKFKAVK